MKATIHHMPDNGTHYLTMGGARVGPAVRERDAVAILRWIRKAWKDLYGRCVREHARRSIRREKGRMNAPLAADSELARLREENALLRRLEDHLYGRRAMEPRHSREDHTCPECETLSELKVSRRRWA